VQQDPAVVRAYLGTAEDSADEDTEEDDA